MGSPILTCTGIGRPTGLHCLQYKVVPAGVQIGARGYFSPYPCHVQAIPIVLFRSAPAMSLMQIQVAHVRLISLGVGVRIWFALLQLGLSPSPDSPSLTQKCPLPAPPVSLSHPLCWSASATMNEIWIHPLGASTRL